MALANIVQKRSRMDLPEIIRFQLATHCYLSGITVSESDLDCLTLLALDGEPELTDFCQKAADLKIFKSSQTVRNSITKAERNSLVKKTGKGHKKITLNPELSIPTSGNIVLDFKFAYVDTPQAESTGSHSSKEAELTGVNS